MDDSVQQSWEDFLNPHVLRPRLIAASLFIAAFEPLRDSIVERIRAFFCHGFDEKGEIVDPTYRTDVLSCNRGPLYASLDWLRQMGAIDDADIAAFNRVKTCRNRIAHRLLELIGPEGMPPDFEERFREMAALLHKIEVWWIKNVDIPTNPDFDGKDIDEAEIIPGPVVGLQLLCDIALGSEEQSRFYHEGFRRGSDHDGA
jgi:hypothetical protein